jgi:hypothetical protein
MKHNSFTQKDVGASVVFVGFDDGSYSATITRVSNDASGCRYVIVRYFPAGPKTPAFSTLVEKYWNRLTRFPANSSFFVTAEPSFHA